MQAARKQGAESVKRWIERNTSGGLPTADFNKSSLQSEIAQSANRQIAQFSNDLSADLKFVAGNQSAADYFRAQAFTIATVENDRIRQTLKESLEKSLRNGTSFEEWKKNADAVFDKEGVSRKSRRHLQVVYRANTALAYAAGQADMLEGQKDQFPFWEYSAVMDNRTRPSHAALHGKIFRNGDWQYAPPLGFNCRCGMIPISKSRAEKLGIAEPDKITPQMRAELKNAEFIGDKNAKLLQRLRRQRLSEEAKEKIRPNLTILTTGINNKSPKQTLLEERENLYFNPPNGYKATYFNRETGGVVLQRQQHNLKEIDGELQIAKTFADKEGNLVELLPERKQPQGVKTPDARHNQKEIWEYKSIAEEATTLRTAVDRKVREVITQGVRNLAILIDRQKYDIQEINKGIKYAFEDDRELKIQNISLIFKEKIQTLKRKEWEIGKRFSRF